MRKNKATIVDIARKLNVSPSTVSRALKDDYQISEKTKKAVLKLAREMHYVPNSVALSLLKNRSHLIGVIVPNIAAHFCATVISSIEEVALASGYHVMILQSNEDYQREVQLVEAILKSSIDGVLVSMAQGTRDSLHFQKLTEYGIPLVFFDRVDPDMKVSRVTVNNFEGALEGVEHLIKIGCQRIAHLAGPENLNISRERKKGYLEALSRHGLSLRPELIIETDLNNISARESTRKLLDLAEPPDAIFCAANPLGAFLEIKERALKIPEDIALLGFTDDPLTHYLQPSISTVAQPIFEMGQKAAELLIQEIEDENEPPSHQLLELKTMLKIRRSTTKSSDLSLF